MQEEVTRKYLSRISFQIFGMKMKEVELEI